MDPVRHELIRAKWIWTACCFSPIIYFLVARLVDMWWFRDKARPGFVGLSPESAPLAATLFLAYGLSLEVFLLFLRRWFNRKLSFQSTSLQQAVGTYLRRTLVLLAVSECAVLGGFVYFLLFGDIRALLIGGVLTYLYYAQSYPSEEGLASLTEGLRRSRGEG